MTVAISAYLIYLRGKKDDKRNAANIIYLEMKGAETLITQAKKTLKQAQITNQPDAKKFQEKLQVMRIGSWSKYRHLFSRDMSPDLWNEIDEFYQNCKLFDEALVYIDSLFSRNESEVRINSFRIIANYFVEASKKTSPNPGTDKALLAKNEKVIKQYKEYIDSFTGAFPTSYAYTPIKPYQDAEYYLSQLPKNITKRDSGKRVKELAE